jgi:hypothetical protein
VLDTRPRELSADQKGLLTSVADAVMTAIELQGSSHSEIAKEEPIADALEPVERGVLT